MPKKIAEHYYINRKPKKKPELTYVEPSLNFMKYYKLCKTWILMRYGINSVELEYMLFLYSEPMFTWDDLKDWERTLGYKINTYYRLKNMGMIEDWIPEDKRKRKRAVMKLSFSAKKIINEFYKVLSQKKRLEYKSEKISKFPHTARKLLDLGTLYYNSWYDKNRTLSASHLKGVNEDKKTIR